MKSVSQFKLKTWTCYRSKALFTHITGRLTKANGVTIASITQLVNSGICFLFMDYGMNCRASKLTDADMSVDLTSLVKGFTNLTSSKVRSLENAG